MWHIEKLTSEEIWQFVGRELNCIKKHDPESDKRSNHHEIPKSREQEWYRVQDELAQVLLEPDYHQKLHNFFGDYTPLEQFLTLSIVNSNVMSDYFKQVVDNISVEKFYKKDLLFKDNY